MPYCAGLRAQHQLHCETRAATTPTIIKCYADLLAMLRDVGIRGSIGGDNFRLPREGPGPNSQPRNFMHCHSSCWRWRQLSQKCGVKLKSGGALMQHALFMIRVRHAVTSVVVKWLVFPPVSRKTWVQKPAAEINSLPRLVLMISIRRPLRCLREGPRPLRPIPARRYCW